MAAKPIHAKDVFETYRSSYRVRFDWSAIMKGKLRDWLSTFESATNCPKALVMSALLGMTGSLCGPGTTVCSNETFSTTLNTYLIAVCDPGGGKSNTFDRIINPVMDFVEEKYDIKICLESYTTAGIHKHQQESGGYGFICSDEGERFLSLVNQKQRQGESERALLCKMWQGKGDMSALSTGNRGFKETSMSTCVLIQPHNLMQELLHLSGEDGIMDRFLIASARPVFRKTSELREAHTKLHESCMLDFVAVFSKIMSQHKGAKRRYSLTNEAQHYYDEIVDNYANIISDKYKSDDSDDEEKENISSSQSNSDLISSKDTCHILRLSAVLHILYYYWEQQLDTIQDDSPPPIHIPIEIVKQSHALYSVLAQQKSAYMQTLKCCQATSMRVKVVKTFREKVTKTVCKYPGPVVPLRELQKCVKGALSETLKRELEVLSQEGFGRLSTVTGQGGKRSIFYNISGTMFDKDLANHLNILKMAEMSLEQYSNVFSEISKTSRNLLMQHPYIEEFRDYLNV